MEAFHSHVGVREVPEADRPIQDHIHIHKAGPNRVAHQDQPDSNSFNYTRDEFKFFNFF